MPFSLFDARRPQIRPEARPSGLREEAADRHARWKALSNNRGERAADSRWPSELCEL
ncbi:hypothetical protein GCM10007977_048570 [Dactylosporangium sucinum]|uniref:Uncharacterized protein n=1 Tax=Dactylosporangium sucinum TaxID=1424081 RepID=A0A917WYT3_9ACTN|nr:hypothetical protein GCM10007977_048570 [Dactylosporangium sucinum]